MAAEVCLSQVRASLRVPFCGGEACVPRYLASSMNIIYSITVAVARLYNIIFVCLYMYVYKRHLLFYTHRREAFSRNDFFMFGRGR